MKLIFLPVIAVIILTFAVTGGELIAKFTPRIDVSKDVDVCDSLAKKRLILKVNIGEIKKSDSLYGYDLEIKYNPDKLKIINYLSGNTLSEFFEKQSFSLGLDGNIIKGYATTFLFNVPPAYGDSILIAFLAEWVGTCSDTTYLQITSLNFTEEFKKDLDTSLGGGLIKAYPFDKSERYANVIPLNQKIELKDGESEFKLKYHVKLPEVYYTDNIMLEFSSSDSILITKAECQNKSVWVYAPVENKIQIGLTNNVNEFDLNLDCTYLLKDTISNLKFYLEKFIYPDCSCVLGCSSEPVEIKKDSNFTSVDVMESNLISYYDNVLTISNKYNQIDRIVLFDLLGREIKSYKTTNETEIKIFTEEIQKGLIFVGIYKGKNYEIKKFYKCY